MMRKRYFKTVLLIIATLIFQFVSKYVFSQDNWFKVGSAPQQYVNFIDSSIQHEGKNVMTLKSVASAIDGFGSLMRMMRPEKYFGKRVRMSGYLRSKNINDWA